MSTETPVNTHEVYWTHPGIYTIGTVCDSFEHAVTVAREHQKEIGLNYDGSRIDPDAAAKFSREWVVLRQADDEGDRELLRWEVFPTAVMSR